MSFKIIDGGGEVKHLGPSREQIETKLKVFTAHMRQIENAISVTKKMAQTMKWDELDKRLVVCHKDILNTLGFIKRSSKEFMPKRKKLPPSMSLVINNTEEDESEEANGKE